MGLLLFRIRIEKFWNSTVLYFCSVVKFHPYSTALSFCPCRKTIFFSKWARLCVLYATPRCGHCKTVPIREAAVQSYTAPPFGNKLLVGGRWRGIYYFFLSGAATLFCHTEHRRGWRHASTPPPAPPSPPPLQRVAPVFPWAKRLWFLADFMSATQVRGKSLLPPPTLLSHVRLGQDFARHFPIFAI